MNTEQRHFRHGGIVFGSAEQAAAHFQHCAETGYRNANKRTYSATPTGELRRRWMQECAARDSALARSALGAAS